MVERRPRLAMPRTELTMDAIAVLRAIREDIDGACVYRGTDAHAAALASIDTSAARTALQLLSRRGLIRLERSADRDA